MSALWYLGSSNAEVKLTAYKTYIPAILEYACVVWDPFQNNDTEQLGEV